MPVCRAHCLALFFILVLLMPLTKSVGKNVTIKLRMGVVLNTGASAYNPVDYSVIGPAIELAVEHVRRDFGIGFEKVLNLYESGCVVDSLMGLNKTIQALNSGVDFLVGPACTNDLATGGKLATVYQVPLMTGAGSLLDSTDAWRSVARFAYNTMTQWGFFLLIARQFNWSNVAVIYEVDSTSMIRYGQSTDSQVCNPSFQRWFHKTEYAGVGLSD